MTNEARIGVLGRAIVDTLVKDCMFSCSTCSREIEADLARAHYAKLMTEKKTTRGEAANFFCPQCQTLTGLLRDHKKGPRKGSQHATL